MNIQNKATNKNKFIFYNNKTYFDTYKVLLTLQTK